MNLTRLAYEFCRMKKCPRFIRLSFISKIDEKAIYAYKGMENWPRQAHSVRYHACHGCVLVLLNDQLNHVIDRILQSTSPMEWSDLFLNGCICALCEAFYIRRCWKV